MLSGYRLRARGTWVLAAATLAALAVAFPSASASAAVPGPGFAIVTMGDSYISGEGVRWNGNEATPQDQWMADRSSHSTWFGHVSDPPAIYGASWIDSSTGTDTGCHRGDPSEADNSGLPATVNFNIACSGAGSDALNAGGPGFKGEMPQVDQLRAIAAVNPVKLIVLSLGGNDLGFGDIVAACVKADMFGMTPCAASQQPLLDALMPNAMSKLASVIGQIQSVMRLDGYQPWDYRLMVQDYPNILPPSGSLVDPSLRGQYGCPAYSSDAEWTPNSLIPEIDANIRATVDGTGAQFIDLKDLFSGHELCSTSAQRVISTVNTMAEMEWVRELIVSNGPFGEDMGWQNESFHPNAYGHQAMATCIGLAYRSNPSQDYSCTGTTHSAAISGPAALPGGGYEVAFQANTSRLWTVGSAGNNNWYQYMMRGTSPSITARPGGGFQVAFQASYGNLVIQGSDGNVDPGLPMMQDTSPSITELPHGGYEAAFQANTSNLWTLGWADNNNWNLGMMPGTSPSIAGYRERAASCGFTA